jgi:hypothetical protein
MYQLAASATSDVYPVAWSRPTLALFGVRDDWVIFIYNITSQDFDAGCFWLTGGMRLTLHMTSHTQNWPPLPPASLATAWETEPEQENITARPVGGVEPWLLSNGCEICSVTERRGGVLLMWYVQSSNLSLAVRLSWRRGSCFYLVPPDKCEDIFSLWGTNDSCRILVNSSFANNHVIQRHICWYTDRVVKQ